MSEPKRIALTTLVSGSATEGAGSTSASKLPTKKDKKNGGDGGAVAKTQRFTLTLPDSTEKSCPEFNFADLTAALPVRHSFIYIFHIYFFLLKTKKKNAYYLVQ